MGTSSSALWQDRLQAVKLDLSRIIALFDNEEIPLERQLIGTFTSPLSGLLIRIEKLEKLSKTNATTEDLWKQLADLQRSVQAEIDSQLEILGGIGIAYGLPQAEQRQGFEGGAKEEVGKWLN